MPNRARILMVAVAVVSAVCVAPVVGAQQTTAPDSAATPERKLRRANNFISPEEIQSAPAAARTAQELIQRLRPQMLRVRMGSQQSGANNPNDAFGAAVGTAVLTVYLDGVKIGDVTALETLNREQVGSIRLLSASDATTRFGTGHPVGAIVITSP
jgi:hypothetical protein